jgi:hypothetical protein
MREKMPQDTQMDKREKMLQERYRHVWLRGRRCCSTGKIHTYGLERRYFKKTDYWIRE